MFQYYIVSMDDGEVQGTDKLEIAEEFAEDGAFVVLDAKNGAVLILPDARAPVINVEGDE